MAHSPQPLTPLKIATGGSALALLLLVTFGTVFAVWSQASIGNGTRRLDPSARITVHAGFPEC